MSSGPGPSVAVVVGAFRGIGAAVARRLAESGVVVVAVDTDESVGSFARSLPTQGVGIAGDARSDSVLHEAMNTARDIGPLRHLFHLAYVQHKTELDGDAAEWSETFDVGVRSAWVAATAFAKLATSPAAIVLTSSNQASRPHHGDGAYAAAKAAVESVMRTLAVELGPLGIRCNAVSPCYVAVERNTRYRETPEAQATLMSRNPLGRLVGPDDVAEVAAFLLGPASAAVTGVCVPVDAGESVFSLAAQAASS